jgi:hypothetical protein
MAPKVGSSCFYRFQGVSPVIEFDEFGCVDSISILSGIVTFRVTLPFDQVL